MFAKSKVSSPFTVLIYLVVGTVLAAGNAYSGVGLGLHGGMMNFMGDVTPDNFGYLGELSAEMPFTKNFSAMLVGGFAQQELGPNAARFTTQLATLDARGALRLPIGPRLIPMVYVGAGAVNFKRGEWPRYWDAFGLAGGGLEFRLGDRLGLSVLADYRYTSGDDFDGQRTGGSDPYLTAKAGLHYYFPSAQKEEESKPLAAEVIELDQKSGVDEEFLNKLLGAKEKSQPDTAISEATVAEAATVDSTAQADDEEINVRITALKTALAERDQAIKQLKTEIQAADERIAYLEGESNTTTQPSFAASNVGSFVDFESQYQTGLQKCNSKAYADAISIFEALLSADPTNKLASNCQYWIGECEFANKNFDQAVEAFKRTLDYPNSPKADDALIMLGRSYWQLSYRDLAQQYFQQLLTDYPDSEYAAVAQRYLGMN